jgi:hypothetical protein
MQGGLQRESPAVESSKTIGFSVPLRVSVLYLRMTGEHGMLTIGIPGTAKNSLEKSACCYLNGLRNDQTLAQFPMIEHSYLGDRRSWAEAAC